MAEVANLILVVEEDATDHDVRQKFRCQKYKVKGQRQQHFQIIYH